MQAKVMADYMPVYVPNILRKVEEKAVLHHFQAEYIKEMMPQHLGLGVKFAARV
jgi:hypothetical protein